MQYTPLFRAALLACALTPLAPWAQAGTITTVAGTGALGIGLDGPATLSPLGYITRLAADEQGRVYIADSTNGRVRRIENGIITTVASGLGEVEGLAVGSGMIYVATGTDRRVLRLNMSTPAAPAHALAHTGDAYGLALSANGNWLYSANGNYTGDIELPSGPLRNYSPGWLLDQPSGLAIAGQNLYIAERGAHRILRATTTEPGITTSPFPVAGNGTQGFSGDGGPATEARLNNPADMALDSAGNLYIADLGNHRVRRVNGLGLIDTIAGTGAGAGTPVGDGGPATAAIVADPNGLLAVGDRQLYVAENTGFRVRLVTFDPPAAPTNVTAQVVFNDRAVVQWTHDGAKATGFTVAVDGDPSLRCTAAPGERSCIINGLSGGWGYSFKAVAHNGNGVSAASAPSPEYVVPYEIYGGDLDLDDTGARQAGVSIGSPVGMRCMLVRNAEFTPEPPSGVPAPPASAPLGVLHFLAEECAAGDRITVRIDYPPGSLAGLTPWKYGPPAAGAAPTWFRHGQVVGDSVYYEVENDGRGDNAPDDIGFILDPHAMLGALPAAPQAIPTLSAWGVALLSALAALLGLRRRA